MLGFVCGNIQMQHYAELTGMAVHEAARRGYRLLISISDWPSPKDELNCIEALLETGVEGIIHFGSQLKPGTSTHEYIKRQDFPVVVCAAGIQSMPSVVSDWRNGMDEAISYLRKKGHTRIGYIGPKGLRKKSEFNCPTGKYKSLLSACKKWHLDEPVIYECEVSDIGKVEALGKSLAYDNNCPSVIIANSDYVAYGISWGLRNEGKRIPEDVAIVGMDGTTDGKYMYPSLTSIAQSRQRIVAEAMEAVDGMIKDRTSKIESILVPTHLIVRESV
jgi:DNA-binding LacI/PurR family transcriptional regulator